MRERMDALRTTRVGDTSRDKLQPARVLHVMKSSNRQVEILSKERREDGSTSKQAWQRVESSKAKFTKDLRKRHKASIAEEGFMERF
jgi:hypothetical protein